MKETIEVDVLCVGAGPAALAAAIRLLKRARAGAATRPLPSVMLVEKSRQVGGQVLSGVVVDPKPLRQLLTTEEFARLPLSAEIRHESLHLLTEKRAWRFPFTPPGMRLKGQAVASLSQVANTLGTLCEQAGAEIYTECAAVECLYERDRVSGVRLGDKGLDLQGKTLPAFRPGEEIHAKVTLLGEGAYGLLAEQYLAAHPEARGPNQQTYSLGIKELIEVPAQPGKKGTVLHALGYPLEGKAYGGGFLYWLDDQTIALGLVMALDYHDPDLRPHDLFRQWKGHPFIQQQITGGKVLGYGAKILPEGGLFAVPRLVHPGLLLLGDSAGLLNAAQLKGLPLAIESGMAAGDALHDCWQHDDWSLARLQAYPARLQATGAWRELWRARNIRAAFQYGTLAGMCAMGFNMVTGGHWPPGRWTQHPDYAALHKNHRAPAAAKPLHHTALSADILTDLFKAEIAYRDGQPGHLVIVDAARCRQECFLTYGAPCTRFCPAQVYERDEAAPGIRIQASNCLHCKTCAIKCPLQNIQWHAPEGGSGPNYTRM